MLVLTFARFLLIFLMTLSLPVQGSEPKYSDLGQIKETIVHYIESESPKNSSAYTSPSGLSVSLRLHCCC